MSSSFKPVPTDLTSTLERALSHGEAIRELARDVVGHGVSDVFLVGCGGSFCATYAPQFVLESRARDLAVFHMTSAEFNQRRPARLGPTSLVVVGSHTGTTPETLAAIETARGARAARVVAVTNTASSALAAGADHAFTYGSENVVWPPKQVILLQLAYALLEETGVPDDYEEIRATLRALPQALLHAVEQHEEPSHEIASQLKDEPITYVLASGPNYGSAYGLAMCYLQEMQWMHAASFNAAEFFHGAFEIVTEETPVLVMLGEDSTRPSAERALDFLRRYSTKTVAIDTRELQLPGIPAVRREIVTPVVLMAFASRLAAHYAGVRDHPLTLRRYMTKVAY
jgi:fructoselysine-6-P-deglycase FrlB-like protein